MHSHTVARDASVRGFTLVEVMVVVLILGLLATMAAHNVISPSETAKETRAAADVHTIAGAVRLYFTQHGRMPDLPQLVEPDAKGRTFLESLSRDPWQNEYALRTGPGPREFEVVSAGADRELGSADDISSRPPPR